MSDKPRQGPDDAQNDSFGDALDDIFGTNDVDDASAPQRQEPTSAYIPEPPPVAPPPPAYQPPASYPAPPPPAPPVRPQRSIGRMIGIGCVVIVAIGFFCSLITLIIGLVAGDPAGTATLLLDTAQHGGAITSHGF